MKFIHCADAHLDSPFLGLRQIDEEIGEQLYQAAFTAFERMVDRAIADSVAFVLIAGDTFDTQNQSLTVQWFLKNQFQRLQAANIQVYLIYGNHDYLNETTAQLTYPENVHIFGSDPEVMHYVSADGLKVAIAGFSYDQRHIQKDMAARYPVREPDTDLMIGLLHGSQQNQGSPDYAPFSVDELLSKQYDYWALGHIHHRQVLNQTPKVIYAGNLQGRNIDESGVKGFYEVNCQYHDLNAEFIPVAPFQWQQLTIESPEPLNVQGVLDHLQEMLIALSKKTHLLLDLVVKASAVNDQARLAAESGQLLETIRAALKQASTGSKQIIYPVDLRLLAGESMNLPEIDTKYWQENTAAIFNPENLQAAMGHLTQERFAAAAFLNQEALQTLQEAAELRILNKDTKEDAD